MNTQTEREGRNTICTYLAQLWWEHGSAVEAVVLGVLYVNAPRCLTVKALVSGIAPPQALNEHRSCRDLSVEMLLTLLLLHFQSETRAQNSLRLFCNKRKYEKCDDKRV